MSQPGRGADPGEECAVAHSVQPCDWVGPPESDPADSLVHAPQARSVATGSRFRPRSWPTRCSYVGPHSANPEFLGSRYSGTTSTPRGLDSRKMRSFMARYAADLASAIVSPADVVGTAAPGLASFFTSSVGPNRASA